MPFKSEEQQRAMYAAASGKSNLGIPRSAAQKFIEHSDDPLPKERRDCPITEYHDACRSGSPGRIQRAHKALAR